MNRRFPEILLGFAVFSLIVTIIFTTGAKVQKTQRDNARKDVINRSVAAITWAASNNLGMPLAASQSLPASVKLPGNLTKPTVINSTPPELAPNADTVYWYTGAAPTIKCSGAYNRGYLAYALESSASYYCVAY